MSVKAKYFVIFRPDGFLFDKEAILEYMLHQKRDIAKKLKEYEKQKEKLQVRMVQTSTHSV
jgi:hypothetical protein